MEQAGKEGPLFTPRNNPLSYGILQGMSHNPATESHCVQGTPLLSTPCFSCQQLLFTPLFRKPGKTGRKPATERRFAQEWSPLMGSSLGINLSSQFGNRPETTRKPATESSSAQGRSELSTPPFCSLSHLSDTFCTVLSPPWAPGRGYPGGVREAKQCKTVRNSPKPA